MTCRPPAAVLSGARVAACAARWKLAEVIICSRPMARAASSTFERRELNVAVRTRSGDRRALTESGPSVDEYTDLVARAARVAEEERSRRAAAQRERGVEQRGARQQRGHAAAPGDARQEDLRVPGAIFVLGLA